MHSIRLFVLLLFASQLVLGGSERTIRADDGDGDGDSNSDEVTLDVLEHWGRYAGAAYAAFEEWESCASCQASEDMRQTRLNATWSTSLPAFSRGFIGVNSRRRQVVVAFRGTTHVMDALADSQVAQAQWPLAETRVHVGFLLAYLSARQTVQAALARLLLLLPLGGGGLGEEAPYSVVFVGHSLGAAQAVLAYVDFCLACGSCCSVSSAVRLVTFGAPRVGNRQFAQLVNSLGSLGSLRSPGSLGSAQLRVVHGSDIVPQLPRSLPLVDPDRYVHGDREIWVRDGRALMLCAQSLEGQAEEDAQCSASTHAWRWSMLDHMAYPGMRLVF
ncbi:hypothetical protein GGI00_005215 [Coemansia sp. RSA 2681]|nr:hypothetical protein GGI00_005215 [Coemansia sp. RSA 2681]